MVCMAARGLDDEPSRRAYAKSERPQRERVRARIHSPHAARQGRKACRLACSGLAASSAFRDLALFVASMDGQPYVKSATQSAPPKLYARARNRLVGE